MMHIGELDDTVEVDWEQYVVTDVYETALNTMVEREPENGLWKELLEQFREED